MDILESLEQYPTISLRAGEELLRQGERSGNLYFLKEGEVSVIKDGFEISHRCLPGSVYGEMSIMLDIPHSATVRCIKDSIFYDISKPTEYLEDNPEVIWHIVKVMSQRIININDYLVDVKKRYGDIDKESANQAEASMKRDKMLADLLDILQIP